MSIEWDVCFSHIVTVARADHIICNERLFRRSISIDVIELTATEWLNVERAVSLHDNEHGLTTEVSHYMICKTFNIDDRIALNRQSLGA